LIPTLELEAKRKAYLFGLLEAIGQRLDLTDVQYERAKTSYEAVGTWLTTASSSLLRNGQVSLHGSVRIQTLSAHGT
jgi:hypothetical protein